MLTIKIYIYFYTYGCGNTNVICFIPEYEQLYMQTNTKLFRCELTNKVLEQTITFSAPRKNKNGVFFYNSLKYTCRSFSVVGSGSLEFF